MLSIKKYLLSLLLILACTFEVQAQAKFHLNLNIHKTGNPPIVGTLWSTLGVVADGSTDNTIALNNLPDSTTIIGDCPGGNDILFGNPDGNFNSTWELKSNLTIYVQSGCVLRPTAVNLGGNDPIISQPSLTVPITNVFIDGITIRQLDFFPNDVRTFVVYINNWTLTNATITKFNGLAIVRGDNHTISYLTATDGKQEDGNVGWRIVGGNNQTISNCLIQSGDGAFQASTVANPISPFFNLDITNVTYRDCIGLSFDASVILVGLANQLSATTLLTASVGPITFERINGSGKDRQVYIQTGHTTGSIHDVTLTDVTVDASADTNVSAAVVMGVNTAWDGYDGSNPTNPFYNVTVTRLTVTNSYRRAVSVEGNTTNVIIQDSSLDSPISGGFATIDVAGTGTIVRNTTIVAGNGNAIDIGKPKTFDRGGPDITVPNTATNVEITNNIITGVTNNDTGINVLNAVGGTITGNSVTSTGGVSHGASFATAAADPNPGSFGVTMTGNNFSGVSGTPVIVCAPTGQGNIVNSNIGASDCP